MGKVLMTEDFTFNMTGAESGRIEKEAGEVFEGADWMCEKLVNHWEVARWHETGPKQTKSPTIKVEFKDLPKSEILQDYYDSLGDVAGATDKELLDITGIGPATLEDIRGFFE